MIENPTPDFDVEAIRRDFPILLQERRPGVPLIYLDNAATSQKPEAVIRTVSDYYRRYNANVHRGIHLLSETATEAYETARRKVQRFINAASRREIIFTRGTTEAINIVAQTWGRHNLKAGDVVLATVMEHHANIVPWQLLSIECGFTVKYVPMQADGSLDLDAYGRMLREDRVKLVAVTHYSNVLGTLNPVEAMSRMAHAAGALIMVDAAQSVPHLPTDVQALDVDFLAFSGHKMAGPTGIGVLYGRRDLLDDMPPWLGGGDMIRTVTFEGCTFNELPNKFEAGTPNIAGAIGLGAAVDYLSAVGMRQICDYTNLVTAHALRGLQSIPQVTIHGLAPSRGSLIAFTVDGLHPHDAAQMLDHEGIAVRAGHHCAMPLHDLLGLPATLRASFYLYNTFAEADALIDAVGRIVARYAK